MKDEHDQQTASIPELDDAVVSEIPKKNASIGKPKSLPRQCRGLPPAGAKPASPGEMLGFGRSVVPVSVVARDWNISPRRVRMMLVEGRLSGRQLDNGYWEVFYPYGYVFGTRGPQIKRQRDLPPAPPRTKRKEPERNWGGW